MKKILLILGTFLPSFAYLQVMLVGPDGPSVDLHQTGSGYQFNLYNPPISNNYLEMYAELVFDTAQLAPGYTDSILEFQGYKVYQFLDTSVTWADRFDTTKSRLVWQCDIPDSIDTLINTETDSLANCIQSIKVTGSNTGIVDTFLITLNPFTNQPYLLTDHPCFYATAYAYCKDLINPDCSGLLSPYLEGPRGMRVCVDALSSVHAEEFEWMHLFPNPATHDYTVSGSFENASVKWITLQGAILGSQQICNNGKVSVENLENGIYIVQVQEGNKFSTQRLIVQH